MKYYAIALIATIAFLACALGAVHLGSLYALTITGRLPGDATRLLVNELALLITAGVAGMVGSRALERSGA